MSSKLIATFLLLFFVGSLLSEVMEGGGGSKATMLTASVSDVSTTLNVQNTSGYLESDYVQIGNERIRYTDTTATTFTGCTRGWDDTTAVAHGVGSKVYSSGATWSSALGFNVATTGSTAGSINMLTVGVNFMFVTMPKLLTWDFAWLKVGWTVYIRWVFMLISWSFAVYMAFVMASALGGVLQSVFRRA